MKTQEAVDNIRHLGSIFADSLKTVTGKDINDDSDFSNGLVAYQYLNLRGKWDYLDESVDMVVRIMYEDFVKKCGA